MAAGQTGANLLSARQSGQWHRHQLRRWGWGWKSWETNPVEDGDDCNIGNWPSTGWESNPPWWRTGRRWAWRGRCCRSWWSPGLDPPSSQGTLTRWPWQEERLSRKYKKKQENVSTPLPLLYCYVDVYWVYGSMTIIIWLETWTLQSVLSLCCDFLSSTD